MVIFEIFAHFLAKFLAILANFTKFVTTLTASKLDNPMASVHQIVILDCTMLPFYDKQVTIIFLISECNENKKTLHKSCEVFLAGSNAI